MADAAAQGADAKVECQPEALGSGGSVVYLHYRTQDAMQNVYQSAARGVPMGDCSPGPSQNTYTLQSSSQTAGHFVCGDNDTGQHVLAWSDNELDIFSVATSDRMALPDLYQWWLHSDPGPN
jgi:hypothetical protein